MKKATPELKPLPVLLSDEAAEHFLETADLTEYDLSGFKPLRFELQPKGERVNMRLPKSLLDEVRARALSEGIPYQRYIRRALESALAAPKPRARRKAG
jgi:predicted DNA binding CopG/RHH family protein